MARRIGSKEHEEALQEKFRELRRDGYRCVDLKGLSPDGVAARYNPESFEVEIVAVEAVNMGKHGKTATYHKRMKQRSYCMFDEVKFILFRREKQ